jgi:hypothetical protein
MMNTPPSWPLHDHRRRSRPVRSLTLVGLVSVALMATGCGGGSPGAPQRNSTAAESAGTSTPHAATSTNDPVMSNTGTGPMIRPGAKAGSGSGGNQTSGSYSVAFAECMRAHGVPTFPNPNGSGIGTDSGVNPTEPEFQAALNGPCQSLAPAGWLSSGPVTK